MSYKITEVDGKTCAGEIDRINGLFKKDFLPLKRKHLVKGHWWLVYDDARLIGFAGSVPFDPFPRVGYLKRAAVLEEYRGKGIQRELMALREDRARASTDWMCLVSECHMENVASANNFIRSGYMLCDVERPWAKETLFWIKTLERT